MLGQLGGSEETLAFVGGNCSILGFDHLGEEHFWTVREERRRGRGWGEWDSVERRRREEGREGVRKREGGMEGRAKDQGRDGGGGREGDRCRSCNKGRWVGACFPPLCR